MYELAPYAVSQENSRGRRIAEELSPGRTFFQRDRDRIIHSTAFRRLEYEVQCFPIFIFFPIGEDNRERCNPLSVEAVTQPFHIKGRHRSVGYDCYTRLHQMAQDNFRLTQESAANMYRVAALARSGSKVNGNRLHGAN